MILEPGLPFPAHLFSSVSAQSLAEGLAAPGARAGPRPRQEVSVASGLSPPQLTFSPDGHQFHAFAGYVIQGFVDIGDFVESHFSSVRFGQPFPYWIKKEQ